MLLRNNVGCRVLATFILIFICHQSKIRQIILIEFSTVAPQYHMTYIVLAKALEDYDKAAWHEKNAAADIHLVEERGTLWREHDRDMYSRQTHCWWGREAARSGLRKQKSGCSHRLTATRDSLNAHGQQWLPLSGCKGNYNYSYKYHTSRIKKLKNQYIQNFIVEPIGRTG